MSLRSLSNNCMVYLCAAFMFNSFLAAQSQCFIHSNEAFSLQSQPRTSSVAETLPYFDRIAWEELGHTTLKDDACTLLSLEPDQKSQSLRIHDFGFDIPSTALITGIELKMQGHIEGPGRITDYRVYLTDDHGHMVGKNKANKALRGEPWGQDPSIYDYWAYGSAKDLWEYAWTPEQINAPAFGIAIELANRSAEAVTAHFDQVVLTVYYEAALDFCDNHNYMSVYADPEPGVVSYQWEISPGLRYYTNDHNPFIITVAAEGSDYGNYDICLNKTYLNGEEDYCCQALEFRNCDRASIGDFIWHDLNGNGLQDNQEPGIDNKRVYLYNESMQFLEEVVTQDGHYKFDDLDPGNYFIKVAVSDMDVTRSNEGDPDRDSDFFEYLGEKTSRLITLAPGESCTNVDFGFAEKSSIEGITWVDMNANGDFENGDEPLAGVVVELLDTHDRLVKQNVSDANGNYIIGAIEAGRYRLRFYKDNDYLPSPEGEETDIDNEYLTAYFDISVDDRLNYNAGFFRLARIAGNVWLDMDYNELYDGTDEYIEGMNIQLLDCQDQYVAEVMTDAEGNYAFDAVVPGQYKICVDNRRTDIYIAKAIECTVCMDVFENDILNHNDFLFNPDANDLSVRLYKDANNNGMDDLEDGLSGLVVHLVDCTTQLEIATEVSDEDGQVYFDGLQNGAYYYSVELSDNISVTSSTQWSQTGPILERECLDIDSDTEESVALLGPSSITGLVWHDKNRNGLYDNAEMGIEGVELQLLDSDFNPLAEISSDINGQYRFEGIEGGRYIVSVPELESVFMATGYDTGPPEFNSDFYEDSNLLRTGLIDLSFFEDRAHIDLGLQAAGTGNSGVVVGGQIFVDGDGNLIQFGESGMASVTVSLYDCNGQLVAETLTDANGFYTFEEVPEGNYYVSWDNINGFESQLSGNSDVLGNAGVYQTDCFDTDSTNVQVSLAFMPLSEIGDRVWLDENTNGQQDASEPGISGVDIILLDADDNVIAGTTTDMEGFYSFPGLVPGTYRLELPDASDSYSVGLQSLGDDATDSELRLEQSRFVTEYFDVRNGDDNMTIDMALTLPQSIVGGTVFMDENMDGRRNGVESGLAGIGVELLDADENPLQEVWTDEDGIYRIYNIQNGPHYLRFELPDGYIFSPANMGLDELFDSDVEFADGRTHLIEVEGSKVIEGVNAGLIASKACIAGSYWIDLNEDGIMDVADPGSQDGEDTDQHTSLNEPFVSGSVVALLDASESFIGSAETDEKGQYLFCDLDPGEYYIQFEFIPGYVFTQEGATLDERLDSDVTGQSGRTPVLDVEEGDMIYGVNAGIHEDNTSPMVLDDASLNGGDEGDMLGMRSSGQERIIAGQLSQRQWSMVYPNPIDGGALLNVAIRLPEVNGTLSYRFVDGTGQLSLRGTRTLEQNAGMQKVQLETDHLPEGIYLLQLQIENKTENHRIVIFSP